MAATNTNAATRRKSYTMAFKRASVRHFEKTKNNSLSARNLKIDRSVLKDWVKKKDLIMDPKILNSARKLNNSNTATRALHYERFNIFKFIIF